MNDLNQDLLAALLDSEDDDTVTQGIPALAAPGVALPLSFSQQQLWFLQQYEPGLMAYNLPRVFRLRGRLQVGALEQAFRALIDRHAVLRTRYDAQDGVAVQRVLASAPFTLGHEDCRHLPAGERQARAAEAVERTLNHVFDLGSAPPLVARVLTVAAEEHVLAVCLHHIASDAWSNPLIARDLAEAYRLALHPGEGRPQWPSLPIQYADHAAWQRTRAAEGGFQRELSYWNGYLGAEVPALSLPTDLPRGTQRRFDGAAELFELDAPLCADLISLGRSLQCTPFMLMLAAWQALLSRQAGQHEFAIGVAHAGRHRPEAQALVGFFINTQVFRARLAPGMSWRTLCRQVRQDTLAAMDHADLPFEVLLDSRTERRDPARSPLFQVMFGLQVDDGQATLALEGLQAEALDAPATGAKFELSLDLTLSGGLLHGRLEYATALFHQATAQGLVEGLRRLLRHLVAHPDGRLGEVALLGEADHQRVLAWSRNDHRHPEAQPVHRLIEAQARQRPETIAVVSGGQQLSYAVLNARANRLARRLVALGVGPDVVVGIAAERSPEMVVGLLAVMKAGGAYLPMDPELPADRLAYMLGDSGVELLLMQGRLRARLPELSALRVIDLDTIELHDEPAGDLDVALHGEHLAYVIYTSGSTGRPKGAANRHRALFNRLAWMQQAYGLGPDDVVLQKTPFSFDVSVWEFFWPLMVGARLVMAPPGAHRDPGTLVDLIRTNEVTTLHFVPSMLQAFLAHDEVVSCTSLRRVVCSGEALPADLQDRTLRALPWSGLFNLYGPTEAAIDVTHWTCQLDGQASVPIGAPISNTRTLILDADLNPVAPGVPGELYLGGEGLARGYLNRAALTAERFVADPFEGEGGRLYRTGDLVRWRQDGQIEYLGRLDHQVKVRGFRIELGEIEAGLLSHEAVREAVVVAHEGPSGARLVAYVTPMSPEQGMDVAQVKAHLARTLPDYMVPGVVMVLEALPLNANGKVDRQRLPAPVVASEQTEGQAPQGEAEEALARVWSQVLGVAQVGRQANFFELGGDSILSLQIVARARAQGWKISPRQLFEHQSVAALAAVAQRLEPGAAPAGQANADALLHTEAPTGPVPLLPIQADFLSIERPAPHHWNQAVLLDSRQALPLPVLEQALQAVVAHHEALRLRFTRADGHWCQALVAAADAGTQTLAWSCKADDAQAIERLCHEAQTSLDLAQGPLLRGLLIEVADGGTRLLLAAHHLAIDGVSWRVLLEDLQTACRQLTSGQPVALPAATSSYRAWSERLDGYTAAHANELAYWTSQASAPARLPCDDPSGSQALGDLARAEILLDAEQTQRLLTRVPTAYRTQVNDVLLTALGRALCRWMAADRVRIDVEGHGREDLHDDLDLSRTIGWFTTLYPVVIDPLGTPGEALKRVKETLRQVPRKGIGHGLFKHRGQAPERQALAEAPPAQVVFNYLGQFDTSFDEQAWWRPAAESSGPAMHEGGPASHELSVSGQVYDGRLRLAVSHGAQRYRAESIDRLMQRCRDELLALISHCAGEPEPRVLGCTPSDFPLAALNQQSLDASLQQLPAPLDRLADLYPLSPMQSGMLFHSLFEPGGSAYLNQVRVDIEGLDAPRLRQAWSAVLRRHAVLRTGFLSHQDQALQWVDRKAELPMAEHDWRGRADRADHGDVVEALDALARADLTQGFDLATPPLMRLALVSLPSPAGGGARHHLVWTYHHLLLDGWSASRLLAEVLRTYDGEAPARIVSGFRDHIAWLGQRDLAIDQAFWQAACARLVSPTRLAPSLPRAPSEAAQGMGLHASELTVAQTASLTRFARRERITLNTLVQAAWALLLKSRTGQQTVGFGATTAGRPADLPGIEHALGLFINTVPVIVDCPPEQTVADWLRALQALNLAARDHEHTPLSDIQRWSGHGGQGLFDNIVVFENYPVDEMLHEAAPAGLLFHAVSSREETNYPMTLAVLQGETLRLKYGYARAAFDADMVAAIAAQVEQLLQQLSEQPHGRVGDLQAMAPADAQRLREWGRNAPRAASGLAVHRLIEAQAVRQPQATALILGDEHLSYAALDQRANRLAHHLITLGVRPEVRVGVCLRRSFDLVVSLLAVLKAGAAFVPLEPDHPPERIAYMVADSGMCLLLTEAALEHRLSPAGVSTLIVDRTDLLAEPVSPPSVAVDARHLAYVIYTSGSTGQPKGVAVTHGPLAMHCEVTAELYEMGPWTREFHFLSFAFDGAHERWLTALLCGASLVVRDQELWSAERTHEVLRRHAVTNAGFPPAYLQQVAAWAEDSGTAPDVGLYSFGGEAMSQAGFEQMRRALRPRVMINGYGPTEAVVTPLLWKAGAHDRFDGAYAPIGRPVGNRTAHILDADLNPVAPGVPGELYLGGEGLARGYLNRAALTAERFVADPFEGEGGRLYRTGDLVRWRQDGQIEYLGRLDHQVKVRGFRIELGEIEAGLLSHEAVREAVVVAHEGPSGARLVAYVTPMSPEQGMDVAQVKAHLARTLPDYMVPGVVMVLEALPLNANGKVDRQRLPAPVVASEQTEGQAPQGEAEEALARVWSQVLGVAQVGRQANFFELGGDSILSLQIVARARAQGWKISPRQLFEHQSVAALAAVAQRMDALSLAEPAHEALNVPVPLLPIQALFFERQMPRRDHWNQSVLLGSDAAMDEAALRTALQAVVRHHDALRLRFKPDAHGGWTQTFTAWNAAQELLWLRQAVDAQALAACCDEAQRSLDLTDGPLLRAVLVQFAAGGSRLLLTAHHLVVDGVSWRILLEDLQAAYDQAREGRLPVLPARTTSYGEWARRLQAHAMQGTLSAELTHWRALADTPADWPADHPEGSKATGRAAHARFELNTTLTQQLLKEAPAAYRTQVNDLLLTAVGRALCTWRGTQAILIDMEGHGREDLFDGVDCSRTVGWFTSVFPVRVRPVGPLGQAIRRVKEDLHAVPGRGLGFGLLGRWGDAASREALVALPRRDVVFNYLGQFDSRGAATAAAEPEGDGQARWWPATESAGASSDPGTPFSHELSFNGQVMDGVLSLSLDYSADRHDARRIQSLLAEVETELVSLIQHCVSGEGGVSPGDFPRALLDADTLDRLVARTGRNARDIEDIYPLTPMQQDMLLDAALDPSSLVNVVQTHALFDRFDLDRLNEAWRTVMARHAVLRTGFFWQGLAEPVQVVFRQADLIVEHHDWQGRATALQEWQALCEHEYHRGFDLSQAPLMRLVVARMDGQHDRLVWTWHHLLLDGWSMSRLLGEVFTLYGGGTLGRPGPAFVEHVLASRQGRADDEAFWRGVLAGPHAATLLAGPPRGGGTPRGHGVESLRLDASATRHLQAFATAQHVTLNTLVQAAWAQVLSAHTGRRAVTFGATVSGRSGDTDRIDEVVGLCINTLPVSVGLDPARPVGDWLRGLLDHNMALRQREHVPMQAIQRWAGHPGQALFDTLIIFENYPVDQALTQGAGAALQVHELVNRGATSTPLTIVVIPGERLLMNFEYARDVFEAPVVADLLRQFADTLQSLAGDTQRRLDQIQVPLPKTDLPRHRPGGSHLPAIPDTTWPDRMVRAHRATAAATAAVSSASQKAACSTSPVLYALPARAWHADEYRSLLAWLDGRHDAVTLACDPSQETAWAGTSIQALAARHAAFIRANAAGRPCCLLGWSVGGLLALETARQLRNTPHVSVAWVGLVDPSGFPMLRGLLAQGQSLLDAAQRQALEGVLHRWLTHRSGMPGHWHALLSAMQPIEREVFLAQVVAAHGTDGEHLPVDGPHPGGAEHALWSEMNCLRLGAACPLPDAVATEVRVWHSATSIEGLADIVARCLGQAESARGAQSRVVAVPGTDHLSVLDAPAFHRGVCEALDRVAGP